MTLTLQLILIILSVFLFLILIKSVKKGKLRSDYALVWLLSSIALIIVAVFPQIAYFAADFIGVISTANMVFAFIIFLLIIVVYTLFVRVSSLEEKQKNLIQHIAILEKELHDKEV
ncbi:DUF2304 domain-containing protein [Thomasclavelia cocleata]|uniref:DUF2304 domain-containing protein n=1 Tax=Thomasclavelia cocleata TaxID=69824 RepID=A0A1I0F8U9_9FIRM|nr:DUF2304 domain-containing protein [Thomasclavelia cocleata]MCR1960623.1 DUF2304 domain-containing protein [Thomasclavelia cocleata]NDO41314.1 DUF2304 domain-containing protein [Thomasclavelia cocleata]PJN80296.1 DUF2304 domain-containing protein [Thomasclavelia cocleata]SET54429.1 hypothetical protein SAMN04489758_11745 [Thomasclavelia cocleata]